MLNDSGKSWHPCLVPDLRGNIENNVCCGFIIYGLYHVEVNSFYAHFLIVFIINGCWILSKAFYASIKIFIWFLSFSLLIWYITLINLHILKNPCIPGINPTWSWCMSFWCVAEFCLLKFCWGFLHLCSSVILACSFLFCVVFGIGIKVAS